jgi:membrane-associated phospholipid phosphatase
MFAARLGTSVALSVLFLVVYSGTNWFTARRVGVPSFFFQWEVAIPFIPAMILPYMSIDIFFVLSPWLCRDRDELRVLSRRITYAILIAGACFLLVPLKFSFTRPQADGILGAIFDWFRTMDQPFNQLPSLHITLSAILLEVYLRATRQPLARGALIVWFVAIASSTVFTFQHHVIDVIGGAVLALALRAWVPAAVAPVPVPEPAPMRVAAG